MKLTNRWQQLRAVLSITIPAFGLAMAPATHGGNHTWSGLGGNSLTSNPQNWSAGGVPIAREANVVLIFPASVANKDVIQDIPNLGIDQLVIQGDGYFFIAASGANYFLRGGAAPDINNGSNNDTRFGLSGALVLNGEVTLQGTSGSVLIEGAITGTGGMTISGPTVEYAGNTVNTYSGLTRVANGTLRLNKEIGVGFAGDLEIGITIGANNNERVILARNQQIPDAAHVLIRPTGWLDLNGYNDTVGPMTLVGAKVTTGVGTLTLGGDIEVLAHDEYCSIAGRVNLGAGNRTITVATNGSLDLLAAVSGAAATTLHKQGPGYLQLSAANTFSGAFHIQEGTAVLFDHLALGSAAGQTHVHSGASLQLFAVNVLGGETIHLSGHGQGDAAALVAAGVGSASLAIQGNVVLDSDASIGVNTNMLLSLDGVVSGPGGFIKTGPGTLWLEGNASNTHTGTNRVNEGLVSLLKPAGMVAMAGPLVVGDDIGALKADVVEWLEDGQLPANAVVTVRGTGFLNLHQQSQTLGGLTLGASAQLEVNGAGILTLPPAVSILDVGYVASDVPGSFVTGRINGSGRVHLAGPTTINAAWVHTIAARISGAANAHLTKLGGGSLSLSGSNSFAGLAIVKDGDLTVLNPYALGATTSGTIVTNSGLLALARTTVTGETLVLAGDNQNSLGAVLVASATNAWIGPITLATDSVLRTSTASGEGLLRVVGPIAGPGKLTKMGSDPLELAGTSANTYQGLTTVAQGVLRLNKTSGVNAIPGNLIIGDGLGGLNADGVLLLAAHQIADSASVTIATAGNLDLNNFAETIGSLAGNGRLYCQLGTLTAGGNNESTVWSGGIQGHAANTLIKIGTGVLRIDSPNFYSGRTIVQSGVLDVQASLDSTAVRVQGSGTLAGVGPVGSIENLVGGTVSPGINAKVLGSGQVAMNPGSTFRVDILGTAPTDYDQLDVTGPVTLSGVALSLNISANTPVGTQFLLIKNDGNDAVVGTFDGLPQGSSWVAPDGQRFSITYHGGDGNDVVVTRANTPPSLPQLTATAVTNEGGTIHINGTIQDPDATDTFVFEVNWGDGSAPQTVNLSAGTQLFHVEHVYTDDKPSGQPSDSFQINYTLTDSSGSPAFGQLNCVVANVPPAVYAGGAVGVAAGQVLNSTLTFADPGADTWTATVDYGDGTGVQPISVGAGKSLPISHAFPSNGVYTVTVEVSDDDTGKGTGTITVLVGLQLTLTKTSGAEVAASWPAVFTGCVLQASPAISGASWVPVPGAPKAQNGQWIQGIPSTNAAGFFRLVRP